MAMPSGNASPRLPSFEPTVGGMLMHRVIELAVYVGEILYLRGSAAGKGRTLSVFKAVSESIGVLATISFLGLQKRCRINLK